MPTLTVGCMVKVRHVDQFSYTLDVEVTAIGDRDEFIGRIQRIFATDDGEICGGDILRLKGQDKVFRKTDVVC